MASENSKNKPETAPDPDEDDLDELDDMLDEFQNTKISGGTNVSTVAASAPSAAPSDSSGPGRPTSPSASTAKTKEPSPSDLSDLPVDQEEFAKQLQAGMAEMLRDLEQNPDMAKQFEEMMSQFGAQPTPGKKEGGQKKDAGTPKPSVSSGPNVSTDQTFQDTIRRTMDRMNASSANASAASASGTGGDDDIMMNLLREMQNASEGGDGDDSFSKMLLGMMEQLTNKEILYEPMKELDGKFDGWLEEHTTGAKKGELSKEDETRYRDQRQLVRDIVSRFESATYSDGNAEDREFIVERMQKMQTAGAPPPELVGDMNAAQEMLGDVDSGCPQQ